MTRKVYELKFSFFCLQVFNRLLGTHSEVSHSSPISPTDLLVALHTIDPSKCELKTVIKGNYIAS